MIIQFPSDRAERQRRSRQARKAAAPAAKLAVRWPRLPMLLLPAFLATFMAAFVLTPTAAPRGRVTEEDYSARFSLCHSGGGENCVVDGDTFWLHGEKIRIADIDTPETHPPRCTHEARLGNAATRRLHTLLNEGNFSLEEIERDTDRYGRKLRIVTRNGHSIGGQLVDEGLARWYGGGRRSWCA